MAKTKSKIPVKRPASEDTRYRDLELTKYNSRQRTSISESGDVTGVKNGNSENRDASFLEVISVENDKNMSENDPGLNRAGRKTGDGLKVRRQTVTVKDNKGNVVSEKKSYNLSYDPDRRAGSEYIIDIGNNGRTNLDDIDGSRVTLLELSRNVKNGTRRLQTSDTLSVFSNQTFIQSRSGSRASSILFTPSRSRLNQGARSDLLRQRISVRNSPSVKLVIENIPNPENDSSQEKTRLETTSVNGKLTLKNGSSGQLVTPLPVREPRLLTPEDRSETNILFKNIRNTQNNAQDTSAVTNTVGRNNSVLSRNTFTNVDEQPVDKALSRLDSKENTSSSLPPLNFKASLMSRTRTISTPRRTPRFSPIPVLPTIVKVPKHDKPIDHDIKDIPELQLNAENKAVHVHSEITFVKDTSNVNRFERLNSTETVRSRYDKKLKLGGDNTDDVNGGNEIDKEDDVERYEDINGALTMFILKPKRHKRTAIPSPVPNERTSGVAGRDGKVTELIQVTGAGMNGTDEVVNNMTVDKGSLRSGTSRRTVSSNEIFSDSDKKAKLKQAQYITKDLRIMKTKLKEPEFIVKHLNADMRRTVLGKAVLNKLNTAKTKKQYVIKGSQGHTNLHWGQLTHAKNAKTRPIKTKVTVVPNKRTGREHDNSKLLSNKTDVPKTKPKHKAKVQPISIAQLNSKISDPSWRVQAKIHRFDSSKPKNFRRVDRSRNYNGLPGEDNRTDSVAKWVLHSASGVKSTRHSESDISQNTNSLFLKRRRKRSKLTRLKRDTDTKSVSSTSTNLINTGQYMPIKRRKLKRIPMVLKKRDLYTQVGKVKGYEVTFAVV